MQNLTPPSNAPEELRPNRSVRARIRNISWQQEQADLPDLRTIRPKTEHPVLPTFVHPVQTLLLADKANLRISALTGIFSRYDPADVVNIFVKEVAHQAVRNTGRLYFLKLILIPLSDKADQVFMIEGGLENATEFVSDAALVFTDISASITEPILVLQDKARELISQSAPSPYNPVMPFIEKALYQSGMTGGFYTIFAQVIGDKAFSSATIGRGTLLIVLTAFEDYEDWANTGLNGGGNDFGWTGTGVVYTYIGLIAEETFSTSTLSSTAGGGWNGTGVVYAYVMLLAFEDFETSTLNGGGADLGWDNTGGAVPSSVVVQPINQFAVLGDTVGLFIQTGIPSATYVWKKNGVTLTDGGVYSGTGTQQLLITGVTATEFDTYQCFITGSGNNLSTNTVSLAAQDSVITTWATAVVTQGGATPYQSTRSAITKFYLGCVTDGTWASMISVNCFATDSLAACTTPLLVGSGGNNPWINNNFVAADLTSDGLVGNASTKYLDTGIIPSAVFANTASGGLSVYIATGNNTGAYCFGVEGSAFNVNSFHLYGDWSDGNTYFDCFGAAGGRIFAANNAWAGYISGNRTASNAIALYKARSDTAHVTIASSASASDQPLAPLSVYCFASHTTGAISSPSNQRLSFGALHTGLTSAQSSNFFSRVHRMKIEMGGGWAVRPTIASPVSGMIAIPGNNVTFSVAATTTDGAGILAYRWTLNGIPLANGARISGAFTASITVSNVQNSDYGTYEVWVYDINGPVRSAGLLSSPTMAIADWSARVNAAGGAYPDVPSQRAGIALITDLHNDGIGSSIVAINGFVPDSLIASITPFIKGTGKDSWQNIGFVAADLTVDGLKGNGTASKYLNTGVIPSATPALSQNNAGLSSYEVTTDNLNSCSCGTVDAGFANGFMLFPNNQATGGITVFCYDFTHGLGTGANAAFNLPGFCSTSRVGVNDLRGFFGNMANSLAQLGATQTVATTGSISAVNTQLIVFNADLARLSWPSARRMSCQVIHTGLSLAQTTSLFNRIVKFRQSLGGGLEASIITVQPVSLVNNIGDTATFSVTATGGGLTYQWQKNGVNLTNGGIVSGATTNTLTLTGVQTTDSDTYQCVITGTVTTYSKIVFLRVNVNAAVTSWSGQVVINGGTLPTSLTLQAVDACHSGLIADSLLSSVLCYNPFVPDSFIACTTPVVKGAGNALWTNLNFLATDLTINGLVGNGSNKALITGFPGTANALNNIGLTIYGSVVNSVATEYDMGWHNQSGSNAVAVKLNQSGTTFGYIDDLSSVASAASPGAGYYSFNRVSSTDLRIYFANSFTAHVQKALSTVAVTGVFQNQPFYVFASWAYEVSSAFGYCTNRISFVALHTGLSSANSALFFARIQTLRKALGGGYI